MSDSGSPREPSLDPGFLRDDADEFDDSEPAFFPSVEEDLPPLPPRRRAPASAATPRRELEWDDTGLSDPVGEPTDATATSPSAWQRTGLPGEVAHAADEPAEDAAWAAFAPDPVVPRSPSEPARPVRSALQLDDDGASAPAVAPPTPAEAHLSPIVPVQEKRRRFGRKRKPDLTAGNVVEPAPEPTPARGRTIVPAPAPLLDPIAADLDDEPESEFQPSPPIVETSPTRHDLPPRRVAALNLDPIADTPLVAGLHPPPPPPLPMTPPSGPRARPPVPEPWSQPEGAPASTPPASSARPAAPPATGGTPDAPDAAPDDPSVTAARWRGESTDYEGHGWEEITAEFRAIEDREEQAAAERAERDEPRRPAISTVSFDEDDDDYDDYDDDDRLPAIRLGRNVPVAVATGLVFGLVGLGAINLGKPAWATLVIAVLVVGLVEMYSGLRQARFKPAAAPGLLGALVMLLGAYRQGPPALGFGLAMVLVFTLLWFLLGVIRANAVANMGLTVLSVLYVGFLGSFALQIMGHPDWQGIALALLALTIASDLGAFATGSIAGRHLMVPSVSPSKSWEGFVGGALLTLVVSVIVVRPMAPFDLTSAVGFALVVIVAAPIGDLIESMLKRAIGIKDFGTVLPGHGGVLDRIDSILIVAPAAYFFARFVL